MGLCGLYSGNLIIKNIDLVIEGTSMRCLGDSVIQRLLLLFADTEKGSFRGPATYYET